MFVGALQGGDIRGTQVASPGECATAPGKGGATKPLDQQVCHQTCVASVAVGEGANRDKPVMNAHGKLVGRMGDGAREVVEHGREVEPSPSGDLDVGK